jgi:hypothetical protein
MGANGKYPSLLIDPAIEKWYHSKETVPHFFKFNRRTILITSTLMIGIPSLVYYLGQKYIGRFALKGVKRGESYLK